MEIAGGYAKVEEVFHMIVNFLEHFDYLADPRQRILGTTVYCHFVDQGGPKSNG